MPNEYPQRSRRIYWPPCIYLRDYGKYLTVSPPSSLLPPHPMTRHSNARARVLLLVNSCLTACASLTSSTSIAPGQAFRLGGEQAGAFVVRGTNAGLVPIVVFAENAGKRDSVVTLAPGAPVNARFCKGSTAIFVNSSPTQTAPSRSR